MKPNLFYSYRLKILVSYYVFRPQPAERRESTGQPSVWKSVPATGFICIPASDDARANIELEFDRTMKGKVNYHVISVEKVYNKQLYRQYQV